MATRRRSWAAFNLLLVCVAAEAAGDQSVVIGETFAIAEPDTRAEIQSRASAIDWASVMKRKDPGDSSAFKPAQLRHATQYAERFFDPTYTVPRDLLDADGNVLIARGTQVNVLEKITLPGRYIVVENTAEQMKWLKDVAKPQGVDRVLIANGGIYELREREDVHFLMLDPIGVQRLNLKAVPSIVEQAGRLFKITEYPL